jgi:hypothetical protein
MSVQKEKRRGESSPGEQTLPGALGGRDQTGPPASLFVSVTVLSDSSEARGYRVGVRACGNLICESDFWVCSGSNPQGLICAFENLRLDNLCTADIFLLT